MWELIFLVICIHNWFKFVNSHCIIYRGLKDSGEKMYKRIKKLTFHKGNKFCNFQSEFRQCTTKFNKDSFMPFISQNIL